MCLLLHTSIVINPPSPQPHQKKKQKKQKKQKKKNYLAPFQSAPPLVLPYYIILPQPNQFVYYLQASFLDLAVSSYP